MSVRNSWIFKYSSVLIFLIQIYSDIRSYQYQYKCHTLIQCYVGPCVLYKNRCNQECIQTPFLMLSDPRMLADNVSFSNKCLFSFSKQMFGLLCCSELILNVPNIVGLRTLLIKLEEVFEHWFIHIYLYHIDIFYIYGSYVYHIYIFRRLGLPSGNHQQAVSLDRYLSGKCPDSFSFQLYFGTAILNSISEL